MSCGNTNELTRHQAKINRIFYNGCLQPVSVLGKTSCQSMPGTSPQPAGIQGLWSSTIQREISLFCCGFTCDFYNSLILNPANDNPSCSSSIKIFQGLFTARESFALAAACLNRWVSRQKPNTNYFHACAASLGKAEGIKGINCMEFMLYFGFFEQLLSSLKRNARNYNLESCLACYGSSPPQNNSQFPWESRNSLTFNRNLDVAKEIWDLILPQWFRHSVGSTELKESELREK